MFKKITLLFLFLSIFFAPVKTYAIPLFGDVKVIDCGLALGPYGSDKCCSGGEWNLSLLNAFSSLISSFSHIPIISNVNDALNEITNVKMKYGKSSKCVTGVEVQSPTGCICAYDTYTGSPAKMETLCRQYVKGSTPRDINALNSCLRCTQKGNGNEYFWSALGCVPLNIQTFINNYVYIYGLGLAGIIVFLCILFNAYRIQFSQGNQEAMKKATDNLKSCLFGLLLIIFAVLIVRIIGADILRIPGLK